MAINIKILKPVVHTGKILVAGALHALEDKVAEDLVKRGLAVKAPEPPAAAAAARAPGAPTGTTGGAQTDMGSAKQELLGKPVKELLTILEKYNAAAAPEAKVTFPFPEGSPKAAIVDAILKLAGYKTE